MTKVEREWPCLAKVMGEEIIGKKLKAPLAKYDFVYALPMSTISMTKGTGIVTSVPSDSPDDFVMLRDLKKKPDYYKVQPEWVDFEPIPIIEIPGMGPMCAQTAVESRKIGGPKDKDKLKEAKDECYLKGFTDGVMTIEGDCNGKKVEDAKLIIKK
jgi:leucyl-tRNA synthetase